MKFAKVSKIVSLIFMCGLTISCSENKSIHVPTYIQDTLKSGSLGPKLSVIPTGTGVVGGKELTPFKNHSPEHKVISTQEYAMGVAEVTFKEFDAFCKSTFINCPDDNGWGRGDQPVINVSWLDAMAYTEWLSEQTNQVYRLPSEAEWEYAARGGTSTNYWWGDEYIQGIDHCDRDLGDCPKGTELSEPGPAGRFKANPFGLFDVTSNVLEWALDCYSPNHKDAINTMESRLDGNCGEKVFKGSNWLSAQPYVHVFIRGGLESNDKGRDLGFRVLREIKQSQKPAHQN
jgi:formylglycine-generating enzyme required for sulfatase activity